MSPATQYALNGLLDNLAHWFSWLGPYRVHLKAPLGITYTLGAFTETQGLRLLHESAYNGHLTKRNELVAIKFSGGKNV
jgi:hypothetical protein